MTDKSAPTSKTQPYCGAPVLSFRSLLHRDPDGGIEPLFRGRRAFFAYNTRVAIHAGCALMGLRPGDEVLAPAYNCGSELDPLIALGLTVTLYPVGADLIADPQRIEPLITSKTRAIYVTHYFGQLQPRMDDLRALCDRHGLRMIEDCALSLLSGPAPAEGRHGDVAVFCFHKFIPTPQGGALVVNADDLHATDPFQKPAPRKATVKSAVRLAVISAMGPARYDRAMQDRRRGRTESLQAQVEVQGLSDIPGHYYFNPAIAGCGMDRLTALALRSVSVAEVVSARRRNWATLAARLQSVRGVEPVLPQISGDMCPQNFPVYVDQRDEVAKRLQARGIAATPWWAGFNRHLNWAGQDEAITLKETILGLPVHQSLTSDHQDHIAATLSDILQDMALG